MKWILFFYAAILLSTNSICQNRPPKFDTQWIPSLPEILTYRSVCGQEEGLYQVSIMKNDKIIEVYINMISSGFSKTVSGTMTPDMHPLQSAMKLFINNQVMMDTKCSYESNKLRITTSIMPYNKTVMDSANYTANPVVDFSQVPLLVRMLNLVKDAQYSFTSLNPKNNTLIPLVIKVIGEGLKQKVNCYKVEINNFEGISIYWMEKDAHHRIMFIEEPESHRTTELLQ